MKTILSHMVDGLREDFGIPVRLLRLLAERPDIRLELEARPPSIAASSIVPWHDLGKAPILQWPHRPAERLLGWRYSNDRYHSFEVERPEYGQIGQIKDVQWECDIQDVHGFLYSKSELTDFANMEAMVETNSQEMIGEISEAMLLKNLAHREIRIIHNPNTTDHFAHYSWDPLQRVFLMNDGGSHHFAAARYIAKRLGKPVPLQGRLRSHSINSSAIESLLRDYDVYVISDETEISNAFHHAMEMFRATWLWHSMPKPYDNSRAILLPKTEGRSMRVSAALRDAKITDLGQCLRMLCANQLAH